MISHFIGSVVLNWFHLFLKGFHLFKGTTSNILSKSKISIN